MSATNKNSEFDSVKAGAAEAAIRDLYAAIEGADSRRAGELVATDVFMLGASADSLLTSREEFVSDLGRWFARAKGAELSMRSSKLVLGTSTSGHSAWFFDHLIVDVMRGKELLRRVPVRLTGMLVLDVRWRLAAAHWSIPLRTNEEQHALFRDHRIPAGVAFEEEIAAEARPLSARLVEALSHPSSLPQLYSTRDDAVAIGSVVDEVFLGKAGKEAWRQFVVHPPRLSVRGGMRGAVVPDGSVAWLAAHIDITFDLTMPYRFFFIWLREGDDWKIVVSHDSVSVDPSDNGLWASAV